ncbi:hypothetical protein PAMP_003730 [Pampus punctatissimus]
MAAKSDRGVPLSTLCPKFLHTNSTSHTWPFSAIAELIDNAYDPDVDAKQIWIDKTVVNEVECLSFMDNGNGLSLEMMHKMLSTSSRTTEFDFQSNRYDIRIPSDVYEAINETPENAENITSYIPESVYSLRNKRIPITFGYNTKSKDQYGIMMYHKNRLIKAYERVGCQLKANKKGVGVIGVIECNFLDPTHNKQNFMETDKYRKTMSNLGIKLEEYWHEIRYSKTKEDPNSTVPVEDTMKRPDQNWVQCDSCLHWRKLPDGIDCTRLPDKWFCQMNPDPQFRSCQVEEEPEDSDDDQPSYCKTYKKQEKEQKKKQETKRQKTVHPPSTPTTPRSRFNTESLQGGAARAESSPLGSSIISQAAFSPCSNSGFPVISNVRSLSTSPLSGKRPQPVTQQITPKRPRVDYHHRGTADATSSVIDKTVDSDDTDDDIFILETASTPKPVFDMAKVKTEREQSVSNDNDAISKTNAAGTGSSESAAAGTSPSPAPPTELASTTTQTEAPKIKVEIQTEGEGGTSNESVREARTDISDCSVEQRLIKQESNGHSENRGKQTLQNGVDRDQDAGPSCTDASDNNHSLPHHPSMAEFQEQQDELLELMQATAQERDSFKEQVHQLTSQLQDMRSRLHELSRISVKEECADKVNHTEVTDDGKDYKSLFEKAKQKVDELIEDKEAFLAATEAKPSTSQGEEKDIDEIALQVDYLVRELDQRNKEREEMRSRVSGPAVLIELRHNVGRLLVSFVPALDLSQVNYECNVLDEILEQVLTNVESGEGWSVK